MRTRKSNDLNLPTSATEDAFHLAVAELLELVLRLPTFWTTFPAGYGKLGKATAGKLKAKGLKAGMPDIMIFHPTSYSRITKVIGLELKAGRNTTSSKQRATHAALLATGVHSYTIRSLTDVVEVLQSNQIPIKQIALQERFAENVIKPTQVELPL